MSEEIGKPGPMLIGRKIMGRPEPELDYNPKTKGLENPVRGSAQAKANFGEVIDRITNKLYLASDNVHWRYEEPQHTDAKVLLLTIGRIAVIGQWYGELGESFLAYAPLPKRNKAREEELGFKEAPDENSP